MTGEGRDLVQALVDRLGELGAAVIEVDTDGIYFVPAALAGRGGRSSLVAELDGCFPPGIQLELDGRYEAMLSYKMKNYVLLDERGKLLIKGSGLRSRGIELFQRLWMEEMFRLLLTGRREEIPALVDRWREDFRRPSRAPEAVHEDGDPAGITGGLSGEASRGQAQPGRRLRAGPSLRASVSAGRPGVLLRHAATTSASR